MGRHADEFGFPYVEDDPEPRPSTEQKIHEQCVALERMLCEKNRKYGDSALKPLRIFSKADAKEQILVRIDDKLSRLKTQDLDDAEDTLLDLLGYLILLRIA